MREALLFKVLSLLKRNGFAVSTFLHTNSCFDIAAKKGNTVIVLKVLGNIDSYREEQAEELKKVAGIFNSFPFIIGERTKVFELEKNFFYERHGINALSLSGLSDVLQKNFPEVKYFKGKKIVELNNEQIRKRRKNLGLSISDLSDKTHINNELLRRFEKGHSTTLDSAKKLEKVLGEGIVKKVNLFEKIYNTDGLFSVQHDSDFDWASDLGMKLSLFDHSPFRAVSEKEEIVIAKGGDKKDVKKKADRLAKTKKVFKQKSFVLADDSDLDSFSHIPIIDKDDLSTLSKYEDLLKLIKHKQKGAK